ncbi:MULTISPECIES: MFS transporter [Streptomyces]|uniref:Major facilitator superfamily transporter (MFS) transporter n=1 Tax=Streptomyces albus (strain ATCC 21838 / DSM 41398 / FERM P-419 / JCM 4703 / NBRC 107858) TaxID=1081613 RepID=A0A0B5FAS6_STRA4|nr:MFS transporter [Streptomyces sp. SCSIO ZS0520]AJE87572.1 major facilitator superfamily transporter (MFS) transporter [Streptomyces albus]AOU81874.1 major facilitator superfamily transporter (MFS) transporter [Streptomyces albus]AYN37560.1 MFS transporter [Streptomyces albus]
MDTSKNSAEPQSEQPAPAASPGRGWRRWAMDTRPLRRPAYRRLWASTIVTAVGSQLTAVAVPKQIYDITGSSAWVGAASMAGLLPLIVFALWGGAVADSMDRRTLLLITNTGIAVTSLLFWIQAVTGLGSVTVLMLLLAVQQAFWGLNAPARSASIARLVPEDELPAANALGSTVMQTGQVLGPLLAGVLIPVVGLPELYLLDALALCATVWAVHRLPALPPLGASKRRAGLREIAAGFRYISGHAVLLLSFLADIVAMVLGMPRALFPQLAAETYAPYGEGLALGLLFAAIPIGAVLGGLFSGTFSRARRHGWMVIGSVVAWGLAVTGFGLSGSLWLAVVFLALAGVADMVSMVFRGAILLSAATDEMRGRMQGVFTVVVAGGPRLADVLHGTAGSAFGPRTAVAGGGVLVVLLTLVLAAAMPALRRYRV